MEQREEAIRRLRHLGGDAFVVEVIDGFLATAARRVDEARLGLAAGDLGVVAFAMHSLTSGAGNLGLTALQTDAGELERAAEGGRLARAETLLEMVLEDFAREKAALEALRGRLSRAGA